MGSALRGKKGSMCPVNRDEPPIFAQLIEERGFDPFNLAAEIAQLITSAARDRKKIVRDDTRYIPRNDAK